MLDRNPSRLALLLACLALSVVACGARPQPTATPAPQAVDGEIVHGTPEVQSIDVLIMESFPVQASALVRGTLADGCTTVDQVSTVREENLFRITITSARPADAVCTMALVPFEESVSLDVYGLPAGTYTVEANGVTQTFTLDVDNILPDATP